MKIANTNIPIDFGVTEGNSVSITPPFETLFTELVQNLNYAFEDFPEITDNIAIANFLGQLGIIVDDSENFPNSQSNQFWPTLTIVSKLKESPQLFKTPLLTDVTNIKHVDYDLALTEVDQNAKTKLSVLQFDFTAQGKFANDVINFTIEIRYDPDTPNRIEMRIVEFYPQSKNPIREWVFASTPELKPDVRGYSYCINYPTDSKPAQFLGIVESETSDGKRYGWKVEMNSESKSIEMNRFDDFTPYISPTEAFGSVLPASIEESVWTASMGEVIKKKLSNYRVLPQTLITPEIPKSETVSTYTEVKPTEAPRQNANPSTAVSGETLKNSLAQLIIQIQDSLLSSSSLFFASEQTHLLNLDIYNIQPGSSQLPFEITNGTLVLGEKTFDVTIQTAQNPPSTTLKLDGLGSEDDLQLTVTEQKESQRHYSLKQCTPAGACTSHIIFIYDSKQNEFPEALFLASEGENPQYVAVVKIKKQNAENFEYIIYDGFDAKNPQWHTLDANRTMVVTPDFDARWQRLFLDYVNTNAGFEQKFKYTELASLLTENQPHVDSKKASRFSFGITARGAPNQLTLTNTDLSSREGTTHTGFEAGGKIFGQASLTNPSSVWGLFLQPSLGYSFHSLSQNESHLSWHSFDAGLATFLSYKKNKFSFGLGIGGEYTYIAPASANLKIRDGLTPMQDYEFFTPHSTTPTASVFASWGPVYLQIKQPWVSSYNAIQNSQILSGTKSVPLPQISLGTIFKF